MADVKGVRVTPVRNPTIPDSISRLELDAARCSHPEIVAPILAPALSAGANTPPEAPVVKENIDPAIRSRGRYQGLYLFEVNSAVVISPFPDPNIRSSIKKAAVTMISAQPTIYHTCWPMERKPAFHRKSFNMPRAISAPPSPAGI